jgi:hypothetical protein
MFCEKVRLWLRTYRRVTVSMFLNWRQQLTNNMKNPVDTIPPLSPAASHRERLKAAQHVVGSAMGWCLSVWWAPVISGVLCNEIEQSMVRNVLTSMRGNSPTDELVDELFWCCRKKLFGLNLATWVPYIGTSFQLLEVYALGQFTIRCASEPSVLTDHKQLSQMWKVIESEIFSGERVVSSYEEFTGKAFPEAIKSKFIPAVDAIRDAYTRVEQIPGVMIGQEVAGEVTRRVLKHGKKALVRLSKLALDNMENIESRDSKKAAALSRAGRARAMSAAGDR